MTFFFDCRFIRVDHHDGISRFSAELFSAISKQTNVTALVNDVAQLNSLPNGTKYLLVNDPTNPWLELWLPRKLNQEGATVVFSPMQTMGSVGKKYRLILTLHDLIYYKHRKPPSSLSWPLRLAWRLFHLSFTPVRILLNRADAVVTISETTKGQIEANRLTRNSVHVVHNASSLARAEFVKTQPQSKNLIYMGSFMPYKNVEVLIESMAQLPDYTLTLCSKIEPGRKKQLLDGVAADVIQRIHFTNGLSESKYQEILDDGFALVTASKDEGFGIPVIEAMSRSVPVVISDLPIFREVAAKAGSYFDPESSKGFVEAVLQLEPVTAWRQASEAGLNQSKKFDWNDSAGKLLAIVNSLKG